MQDQPISLTRLLQEGRFMKFESTYEDWVEGRLTQSEVAAILGQCERTFRRNIDRFKSDGLSGLMDLRISKVSMKKAGKKGIDYAVNLYKDTFKGWNVAHFHSVYKTEFKGKTSYSWLKTVLQGAGVVRASKKVGKHRIKRERAPLPGMMLHQDASTHRWVPESVWDLVVTMDDATSMHTSMFFAIKKEPSPAFTGLVKPFLDTACLLDKMY
jgi:transposase